MLKNKKFACSIHGKGAASGKQQQVVQKFTFATSLLIRHIFQSVCQHNYSVAIDAAFSNTLPNLTKFAPFRYSVFDTVVLIGQFGINPSAAQHYKSKSNSCQNLVFLN